MKRSRTQLAKYIGVQHPSFARTKKGLEDESILATSGRINTVLDRNKLGRILIGIFLVGLMIYLILEKLMYGRK